MAIGLEVATVMLLLKMLLFFDKKSTQFENKIKQVCDYIEEIGGHAHKNHAERLQDGTYIKGEPFDYEIFLPNYKAVFDAKECKTREWLKKIFDNVMK